MQSIKNSTTTPLAKGGIFFGSYDDVIPYSSIVLTINSDTTNEISVYASMDKKTTTKTIYISPANEVKTFIISPSSLPYIYITVRNNSNTNQTLLNFCAMYSPSAFY